MKLAPLCVLLVMALGLTAACGPSDDASSSPPEPTRTTRAALDPGPCGTATLTASPSGQQLPGTQVTLTAGSTGCPNPLYEFWVLPPGGSWTIIGAYATSSTFTWDTTALAPGNYELGVWAKDTSSTTSTYDASAVASYALGPSCASVTVTPSPAGPQAPGTQITLTASSNGCPNPLYEFWVLPPGGSWTSLGAYGTSSTFTWDTTGLTPGTYVLGIWAKDASSPTSSAYDVSATANYPLGRACASASLGASPAGPQVPGTQITLSASSTGCPTPLYEFWVLPPGGSWTIIGAYSTAATFTWDTTGLSPGAYELGVWAKDSESATSTFDVSATASYSVGRTCAAASLTASPTGQQLPGTQVTLHRRKHGLPDPAPRVLGASAGRKLDDHRAVQQRRHVHLEHQRSARRRVSARRLGEGLAVADLDVRRERGRRVRARPLVLRGNARSVPGKPAEPRGSGDPELGGNGLPKPALRVLGSSARRKLDALGRLDERGHPALGHQRSRPGQLSARRLGEGRRLADLELRLLDGARIHAYPTAMRGADAQRAGPFRRVEPLLGQRIPLLRLDPATARSRPGHHRARDGVRHPRPGARRQRRGDRCRERHDRGPPRARKRAHVLRRQLRRGRQRRATDARAHRDERVPPHGAYGPDALAGVRPGRRRDARRARQRGHGRQHAARRDADRARQPRDGLGRDAAGDAAGPPGHHGHDGGLRRYGDAARHHERARDGILRRSERPDGDARDAPGDNRIFLRSRAQRRRGARRGRKERGVLAASLPLLGELPFAARRDDGTRRLLRPVVRRMARGEQRPGPGDPQRQRRRGHRRHRR